MAVFVRKTLLTAWLLSVVAPTSLSNDWELGQAYKTRIEQRLETIVKAMDEQALVFLKVTFKESQLDLPGTPFNISTLEIKDTSQEPEIRSLAIEILTRDGKVPEDALEVIKNVAKEYHYAPSIVVKELPAAFIPAKVQAEPLTKLLSIDTIILIILGALGFYALFTMLHGWLHTRRNKIIKEGVTGIVTAIESSGSSGRDARSLNQSTQNDKQARRIGSATDGGRELFADFSAESLLALLTDAYWTENDQYAAYVWRRIPIQQRTSLLASDPKLHDYVSYLAGIQGENLGYEQEAYYLNPLTINHIDMHALTEIVKKEPMLLQNLSSMRMSRLQLSVTERLDLLDDHSDRSKADIDQDMLRSLGASQLRHLQKAQVLTITTIKEEEDVLARELPLDVKESIPSLGWLLGVEPTLISEILKGFTAQELAEAWIGPEAVLERLAESIPEKKRQLMMSYREKTVASRESETFRSLHQLTISVLRQAQNAGEQVGTQNENAA